MGIIFGVGQLGFLNFTGGDSLAKFHLVFGCEGELAVSFDISGSGGRLFLAPPSFRVEVQGPCGREAVKN